MACAAPSRPGISHKNVSMSPISACAARLFPPIRRASTAVRWPPASQPQRPSNLQFQLPRQLKPHRQDVSAAASIAAASGVFEESPSILVSLRRRGQQLLFSPHDKEIWGIALPAFVAMLLEPVMNAINAGMVGHLGTQQLGAVSMGSLAVSFVTFLFSFLLFLTVPEIAAAVVKDDDEEVSRIAARSIWIAGVCGVTTAAVLYCSAGAIVAGLNPPEAAVAAYATEYIRIRSLGLPAALLGYVATGVFRGFRDTRTPLAGAVVSAVASLGLNTLFLYVLGMGVAGAAAATTTAQGISAALLMAALLAGGRLRVRHLRQPPTLHAVLPTLQLGAVLGVKNVISFGMVLYASAMFIRLGAVYQASFEVVRQIWILTVQFFECLNVATQALCATYLGKEDVPTAVSLLLRLLLLGTCVGGLAGAAVWAAHPHLIAAFTRDPEVVRHVMTSLPMICLLFPLDAAASIMDGSLLAAKQSNYMSAVQIAGSVVQYGVMAYMAAAGHATPLNVWAALKILPVVRVTSGVVRNYYSPKSAYLTPAPVTSSPLSATAAAPSPPPPSPPAAPYSTEDGKPGVSAAKGAAAVGPSAAAAAPTAGCDSEDEECLLSFEEDVVAMACAATTAATDMHADMLQWRGKGAGGGHKHAPHQPQQHQQEQQQ